MAASSAKRRSVRAHPKSKTRSRTKSAANATKASATTKIDQLIAALRAPKGAMISDLVDLTGWQIHSVRGAISGALKKHRSLNVISEKVGDQRFYRIVGKS